MLQTTKNDRVVSQKAIRRFESDQEEDKNTETVEDDEDYLDDQEVDYDSDDATTSILQTR